MQCRKCGSDGPFYDSAREGSEAYEQCQPCLRGAASKLGKDIKKARRAKKEIVVSLPCRVCKKDLPSTDFAPSAAATILIGFSNACRTCRKPIARASYLKRKEKLAEAKGQEDFSDLV